MGTDSTRFKQAISVVNQERSYLHEERCAFEAFREQVRLTTADPTDATGPTDTTEHLLSTYRDEVMETLNYEAVYGDNIAESLEAELSTAVARVIISKEPLTQRRKRDLLIETTAAINRREKFCAELAEERATLETFAEKLTDIEKTLEKLPTCSARQHHLEKLIDVWEVYDELLGQCEQLLELRQQQIQQAELSITIVDKRHARNEFLYSELDTRYPVLSNIAATCDRITSEQHGEQAVELPERSLQN